MSQFSNLSCRCKSPLALAIRQLLDRPSPVSVASIVVATGARRNTAKTTLFRLVSDGVLARHGAGRSALYTGVEPARSALILETADDSTTLPPVSTLVLNLDDRLKRRLDALAAHNHKQLPDWAAEQLGRLAADAGEIPAASYSPEWMAAFGSIDDPSFRSLERPLPTLVEPLDSGI